MVLENGEFYFSSIDVNNHFENNILRIEKFNPNKVWTAVLFDADNEGYPYVKRFVMEAVKKHQSFVGENPNSKFVLLTDQVFPRIRVTFGGADAMRTPIEIEVEEFVGVKGFKAKGKRIATWKIESIEELEPTRFPEPETEEPEEENEEDNKAEEVEDMDPDAGKSQQQVIDEITGQLNLF